MHISSPILGGSLSGIGPPLFHHPRSMHLLLLLVTTGILLRIIDRINLVKYVVDALYSVSTRT